MPPWVTAIPLPIARPAARPDIAPSVRSAPERMVIVLKVMVPIGLIALLALPGRDYAVYLHRVERQHCATDDIVPTRHLLAVPAVA